MKIFTKNLKKNVEQDDKEKKVVRPALTKKLTIERFDIESEDKLRQAELIQKLHTKETTSVALKWFFKRDVVEEVEGIIYLPNDEDLDTPLTRRQRGRESTELRLVHKKDNNEPRPENRKVKEYSEQFVQNGARQAADYTKRKNIKDILRNAKPKVDCRIRNYDRPIITPKVRPSLDTIKHRGACLL